MNKVLQKTKSSTFDNIAVERHHNSEGNRPGVITLLELLIKDPKSPSASEQQVCIAGENSKVEYTYGWYSASAGNNDMQGIISNVKL
jgi:hypothetical protein